MNDREKYDIVLNKKKEYMEKIIFWKILEVYLELDPLTRLPSMSLDEYHGEATIFLALLEKYKLKNFDLKSIIEKIHFEVFHKDLDEGLALLLRDRVHEHLLQNYKKTNINQNKNEDQIKKMYIENIQKIKQDNNKNKIFFLELAKNKSTFSNFLQKIAQMISVPPS